MAVHLTVDYKAQFIANIISGLTKEESAKASKFFEKGVAEVLARFPLVNIDESYVRYGLDIGLISTSKSELGWACREIADVTQEHPSLKDVYFESFEGIQHN